MSKQLSHRTYEVIVPICTLTIGLLSGAVYGFAVANAMWEEKMSTTADNILGNTNIGDFDMGDYDDWQ